MIRDHRTRRRSPEVDEKEYVLFLHGFPTSARWQELKDLAREYGTARLRAAETISPNHEIGFIFIVGLKNAENAFKQFARHGWRGKSIEISLNGPVDRAKFDQRSLEGLKRLAGPVRSPEHGSRATHPREHLATSTAQVTPGRQVSLLDIPTNLISSSKMQHYTPPPPVSPGLHRPPASPYVTMPASAPVYGAATAHQNPPILADGHPSVLSYNQNMTQGAAAASSHSHNRHTTPIGALATPFEPLSQMSKSNALSSSSSRPARKSITVYNLAPDFKKTNAEALFKKYGIVGQYSIQQQCDARGRVRSVTAYADYFGCESAERAVRHLDGYRSGDRTLHARYSGPESDSDRDREQERGSNANGGSKSTVGTRVKEHASFAGENATDRYQERRELDRVRDKEQDRTQQRSRGPLVVDGAKGNARRRRDLEARSGVGIDDDSSSDSERSDEEREARRRDSSGSGSTRGTRCTDESEQGIFSKKMRSMRV